MNELPYYTIPDTPNKISASTTIARFVDGLGFRYRWATEGLTSNEIEFIPVEGSRGMLDIIRHIYNLAHYANWTFGGTIRYNRTAESFAELRVNTLILYADLSMRLKNMDDSELEKFDFTRVNNNEPYSFWYMLNGPIADALTHVGQITSWRRIAGNPQPKGVDVFAGSKSE